MLDWAKPGSAFATAAGTVFLALIVHVALFGVYKLRVFIHDSCTQKNMVLPTKETPRPTSISMVLGSGYTNDGFKGSTEVV